VRKTSEEDYDSENVGFDKLDKMDRVYDSKPKSYDEDEDEDGPEAQLKDSDIIPASDDESCEGGCRSVNHIGNLGELPDGTQESLGMCTKCDSYVKISEHKEKGLKTLQPMKMSELKAL
jgi:hypothetical protein